MDADMQAELSKTNTLLDYCCTIGLPHSKVVDYIHQMDQQNIPITEASFSAAELAKIGIQIQVTSRFPEFDKTEFLFPEEMCTFCFPNGLELCDSPNDSYGNFTLTNDKGLKVYVSFAKVHNSIDAYRKAMDDYQNLKTNGPNFIQPEATSSSIISDAFDITRVSVIHENNAKSLLEEPKIDSKELLKKSPEGIKKKKIFIPMCICFISKFPYLLTHHKILKSLLKEYQVFLKFPIEYYILTYVTQIPAPPKGIYNVKFFTFTPNNEITLYQYPLNSLPYIDINYSYLISMPVDVMIAVFNSIILEKHTLFLGRTSIQLANVIEGFLSLLYPFEYMLVGIPLLPPNIYDVLLSPIPYIIGADIAFAEDALSRVSEQVTIVNLEKMQVFYSDPQNPTLNPKPHQLVNSSIPSLPNHEKDKLHKRIINQVQTAREKYNKDERVFNLSINGIRKSFLLFLVSTLKGYSQFLNEKKKDEGNLDKYFSKKDFAKYAGEQYTPFLLQFMDTQMFQGFIERKVNPKCSEHKLKADFFDENITAKLNRCSFTSKGETPFLNDKTTMSRTKLYSVPLEFSDTPKVNKIGEYIIQNKNWLSIHATSHIRHGKGYYYNLFPEFITPCFPKPKNIAQNLIEDAEFTLRKMNMFNPQQDVKNKAESEWNPDICIYSCWIEIWCSVLWQQAEDEKLFRFEQLLEVLISIRRKDIYLNKEIYILILQTISKYGTPQMVVTFYKNIIQEMKLYNALTLSYYSKALCSINANKPSANDGTVLTRLLKEESIYGFKTKLLDESSIEVNSKFYENRIKRLRKRTFLLPNEKSLVMWDNCKISFMQECKQCHKTLNYNDLIEGINLKTDFKCNHCNKPHDPCITIELGWSQMKSTFMVKESCVFVTYFQLLKLVETLVIKDSKMHLEIAGLRSYYKQIYWNLIWYLSLYNLPFDFFMSYANEELPATPNPLHNLMLTYLSKQVEPKKEEAKK